MANHPHDSKRPPSAAVKLAVEIYREEGDIEPLRRALSPRMRTFCEEYVVDFNATAAAIRAGYAQEYADRQAYVLNHHVGCIAYIDYLNSSKEAKIVSVSPDYVIQKVTEIITKAGSRDGDKLRGLELLARHLGMFVDRTEITGKDGDAIRIEQQKVEEEAEGFLNVIRRISDKSDKDKNKGATLQ
jgi:phage terminase small subunit